MSFVNVSIDWGPGVQVGGVGGNLLYDIYVCFKAVVSPTKLFSPREQGYNFQRLFMILACVAFPAKVVCWTSVGIWCPDILKIYFI